MAETNDRIISSSFSKRFRLKVVSLSETLLQMASSFWARVLFLFVAVVILIVLLWITAWRPLLAPVQLPAGVLPDNAALADNLLKELNDQRVQRFKTTFQPFDAQGVFGLK